MIINYSLIGQRIRTRRTERKLTQEDIADYLDISVSYISRIERATVKISLETLVRVATFLEVSPAFLIDGTIAESGNYLRGEIANIVNGFDAGKMKLLLEISQSIAKF